MSPKKKLPVGNVLNLDDLQGKSFWIEGKEPNPNYRAVPTGAVVGSGFDEGGQYLLKVSPDGTTLEKVYWDKEGKS